MYTNLNIVREVLAKYDPVIKTDSRQGVIFVSDVRKHRGSWPGGER